MKSLVLFLVVLEIILSFAQFSRNQTRRSHWIQRPQQNVPLCQNRGIPPNAWPKIGMHHMILPAPSNAAWRTSQAGKTQNQRYPVYRYHWIPPLQQKVQGCLIPPNPWSGLRTNQLILPASAPSTTAWRPNQLGKNHYHWAPAPPQPRVQGCLMPPNPWPKLGTNQLILPAPASNNVGPNQGMYNWMNPFDFGLPNYFPHWGYPQHYPGSIFNRYTPRLPIPNLGMPLSLPFQPSIHRHWPFQPHFGPSHDRWHMQFFGSPHGIWHILPNIEQHIEQQVEQTDPPYYIAHRI